MRPARGKSVWQCAVLTAVALAVTLAGARGTQASALLQVAEDPLPRIKALREEGRLSDALAVATEALGREPGRRDLRMERGYLLGALGRYDEALADYETVLAENPGDVEALLEHAQVRTLQAKYDEAEGEFRFILALGPGLPGASFGLGDVLTWKGDLLGARAAYLEYVRARPEDPRGHLRLANLALQTGDGREARARFQEALRLDPANAEAQAGLARADYPFRFELGYTHETLTRGQPDWRQGSMLLTFRPFSGTEFRAGGQAYNRFGQNDQLVTVGFSQGFLEWAPKLHLFTLSGEFSQGLNGRFLPKQIYEGQLTLQPAPRLQLFASYHFLDFNGNITASTISPGAEVRLAWRFYFLGRYFRTESTGNEPSNAFLVQFQYGREREPTDRFVPYLGVARGGLGAGARTTEELLFANSQFTSFFAGFSWRILARFGIKADYAVQRVKEVYTKHTFGLATFFEF